jgi:hypothetical protein
MLERENASLTDPSSHVAEDIQYFELIDNLAASGLGGESATAYLCDYSFNRLSGSLVTIYSPPGATRLAYGSAAIGNDASGNPRRGAFGQGRYNERIGALEVLSLQRLAQVLVGAIDASFYPGSTCTLNTITAQNNDQVPPLATGGKLTIANEAGFGGNAGDNALAVLEQTYVNLTYPQQYSLVRCPRLSTLMRCTCGLSGGDWRIETAVPVSGCYPLDGGELPAVLPTTVANLSNWFASPGCQLVISGPPNNATGWVIVGVVTPMMQLNVALPGGGSRLTWVLG